MHLQFYKDMLKFCMALLQFIFTAIIVIASCVFAGNQRAFDFPCGFESGLTSAESDDGPMNEAEQLDQLTSLPSPYQTVVAGTQYSSMLYFSGDAKCY